MIHARRKEFGEAERHYRKQCKLSAESANARTNLDTRTDGYIYAQSCAYADVGLPLPRP